MNQQEILKKIGGIIAELKEQHAYIAAADNAFNDLELELFMANANFLTDHIEILKKIYGQAKFTALPVAAPVLSPEEVYPARPQIPDYFGEEELLFTENEIPEALKTTEVIEIAEPEQPEAEETVKPETIILPETMLQTEQHPVLEDASFSTQKTAEPQEAFAEAETAIVPQEIEPVALKAEEIEPEIIAPPAPVLKPEIVIENEPATIKPEVFKEQPLTLNQRIAAQKGLNVTAVSEKPNQPVPDLQSLINLNDKLLFVKELFNGYNLAYSEAINILNRYNSFEQAENFLNLNYVNKNKWKEKPATAERFYNLLRKRFS